MAKKTEKKTVHNDLDDLPVDEPIEEFDETDPSQVLNLELSKPDDDGADDKGTDDADEGADDSAAAQVAADAVEGADADQGDDDEPGTGEGEGEGAEAGEGEPEGDVEPFHKVISIPQPGGGFREVAVTSPEEAEVVESLLHRYDETRGQLAPLQQKHLEALERLDQAQRVPAQPRTPGAQVAPAAQPTGHQPDQTDAMMEALPRVVEAYNPTVQRIHDSLPEDHEIREYIELNPMMSALFAAIWDGQVGLQMSDAQSRGEAAANAFRGHVDTLVNNIVKSDKANADLADPDVREQFDKYLVSLGPYNHQAEQHDPEPIRVALMQDDGRWLNERWKDFQSRRALGGMTPSAGDEATPAASSSTASDARRRAIDAGGGSRSGTSSGGRGKGISKDVMDVLRPD